VASVKDTIPPTYTLKEYDGTDLSGIFYNEELIKVIVPKDSLFKIEKIIRERGKGKKKEYLVKWLGYPDHYNSWISNIQHV